MAERGNTWHEADKIPTTVSVRTRTGLPIVPSACNFCKKRKIKCDGGDPCFQCLKRNYVCEYRESANREVIQVAPLANLADQESFVAQINAQKELASYWKNVALQKEKPRKPYLTEKTQQLVAQSNAHELVLGSFFEVAFRFFPYEQALPPQPTIAAVWSTLVEAASEDIIAKLRSSSLDEVAQHFDLSVRFLHGANWLEHYDLAYHFQKIAQGTLTVLLFERDLLVAPALMNSVLASLIYFALYYKARGQYPAFAATLGYVAQFLDSGLNLDKALFCRGTSIMILNARSKLNQRYWQDVHRAHVGDPSMCNCKYFKNISKAFSALTMPHGDYSPETLAAVSKQLDKAEISLEHMNHPEMCRFYYIWICGLRAVVGIHLPHYDAKLNVQTNIKLMASVMAQLQHRALYLWLASDLFYFHYAISKSMPPELCLKYQMVLKMVRDLESQLLVSGEAQHLSPVSEQDPASGDSWDSLSDEVLMMSDFYPSVEQFEHWE